MKVCIIGAGNVGATIAYTLMMRNFASIISLIDVNAEKALGEVLDLNHGMAFSENETIVQEGYEGVADADVIVITAGRGRKPDESRFDLARANVRIVESIIDEMKPHYNGAIVIVVSNPMDVLTYVTCKRLEGDPHRIIGSGTVLDTARFKYLLSKEFDIDPRNIHAYIIGEHGDSSVPVWSMASLGQIPLNHYLAARLGQGAEAAKQRIYGDVVSAGKEVIRRKGATFYAVAMSVARILEAIHGNERSILTVSSLIDNMYFIHDVCLSMPAVITIHGIREIMPINLSEEEYHLLLRSAEVLKQMIREVGY